MMWVRRLASARATTLRRYPSSAIAFSILARVAGVTGLVSFSRKDTVAIDTPARSATSRMVTIAIGPL
ncbi:hypothetical protein GCM10009743_02990 [Kribbella swartbergensis]